MELDDLGIDELVKLMDKKEVLIREGNMSELIRFKAIYPDLFNATKEKEINDLLLTVDYLSKTSHFKAMIREEQKSKFIPVDFESWKKGMLDDVLREYVIIKYADIHSISRILVKESIVTCCEQCGIQNRDSAGINKVLPFMGILINEILLQFPREKQKGHLTRIIFKLREEPSVQEKELDQVLSREITNSVDAVLENKIQELLGHLLKKILFKFDKRLEWYTDLLFFSLIEVTEFVALLITNIGENKNTIIKQIENKIVI